MRLGERVWWAASFEIDSFSLAKSPCRDASLKETRGYDAGRCGGRFCPAAKALTKHALGVPEGRGGFGKWRGANSNAADFVFNSFLFVFLLCAHHGKWSLFCLAGGCLSNPLFFWEKLQLLLQLELGRSFPDGLPRLGWCTHLSNSLHTWSKSIEDSPVVHQYQASEHISSNYP